MFRGSLLRYIYLFFLLLTVELLNAQTVNRKFRTISIEKGLSQSTVYSIVQDRLGAVWMATQEGLNRYNGASFDVFRSVGGAGKSISSDFVKVAFVDRKGDLWFGGDKGVSKYNYATDDFINYKVTLPRVEWYITSIVQSANGVLLASSYTGQLYSIDTLSAKLTMLKLKFAGERFERIYSTCFHKQHLYLATDNGIFILDSDGKNVRKLNLPVALKAVNELYTDGAMLWIASEGAGLLAYQSDLHTVKQYLHQSNNSNSLIDNLVRSVAKDAIGNIWVGTFEGLSVLNPKTGDFNNYVHQNTIPYTISQNSVRCIYRDSQNGMWLGTYYGGVNYYHADDILFDLLNLNTGRLSLKDEVINSIKEDPAGNFWIGGNDKGLSYWLKSENKIRTFSYQPDGKGLSSNNIKSIAFLDNQSVMLGTHNAGLNILNPETGTVQVFRHTNQSGSISGDMVYALLKDRKGRIWVGTYSGLDLFDPIAKTFQSVAIEPENKHYKAYEITYLTEDSKGRIWVGTTSGINFFSPDLKTIENLSTSNLEQENINCIVEDNAHHIWVGSRYGLSLYDERKKTFITHKERSDFINSTVYGILPDSFGNLWISTNRGLACYNPQKKNIQWFSDTDGLQSQQFNLYAFCKAKDGMLLFGGIKGVSYFYPFGVRPVNVPLKVTFTGLDVFSKRIAVGDGTGILNTHIDRAEKITLNNSQRQFSLWFNTFNYVSTNRTKYLYRLKGVDKEWSQTDAVPKVTYANLNAGDYEFEVKAVGPNGQNSAIRTLVISILPPWYASTWFIVLVVILILIAGFFAYRISIERIRTLQQLRIERIERDKVSYINQVKTDFFTNVSHELRTPLTLILAPLEAILRKPSKDKQLYKQHKTMQANAMRLYQLVDQLFEFRKAEAGTRKLKVRKGDILPFIHDVFDSFQPLAAHHQIDFSLHISVEELFMFYDADAMEKILFNILSNAFKYTSPEGKILIEVAVNDGLLAITVKDSGQGIPEEHLAKIFDRFYQVNASDTNLGSGVGLAFTKKLVELHHGSITVQSEVNKGTFFTVMIPVADKEYTDDIQLDPLKVEAPAENEVDAEVPEIEESRAKEPEESGRERLLIVDDNPEIVEYLSAFFREHYNMVVVFNGQEALEVLEDTMVDLIICDVMMPELDGLHFCKRVKQNIQTCHIPIILLTANADPGQHLKGLEMGSDDYVTKPFSMAILEAKVQNILKSRKRLKEIFSHSKDIVPENIAFNSLDEAFLKSAIEIIEKNLSNSSFSVDRFAKEIGMSRSSLYLKVKAITGESVTDFIKRIRFKYAVELIESKQYTMSQIAYMSGFNSPSYFSTSFKQYYDCMPTEYLNQKMNESSSEEEG